MTLVELVASSMILAFIVAATAGLYGVGQRQQGIGRNYSIAQTDLRSALRGMTRTIRHGYSVQNPGTLGNLAGIASDASQVVVLVPQPLGQADIEVRYHRDGNGVLYCQRSGDAAPGSVVATGISALQCWYLGADGATQVTPSSANIVVISLTADRGAPFGALRPGAARTTVRALVNLRNSITGI